MFSKTFPVTDPINSLIHARLYQIKIKIWWNYSILVLSVDTVSEIPDIYSIIKPDCLVSGVSKLLSCKFLEPSW